MSTFPTRSSVQTLCAIPRYIKTPPFCSWESQTYLHITLITESIRYRVTELSRHLSRISVHQSYLDHFAFIFVHLVCAQTSVVLLSLSEA